MKQVVKNFGQFINEATMHTQFEAQVDIELGLGQTAGEMADFFSYLAELAPNCVIMDIEVEDVSKNPNALAILTFAGENSEISRLDQFNQENSGDASLERRFNMEDHPEDLGTIDRERYEDEEY